MSTAHPAQAAAGILQQGAQKSGGAPSGPRPAGRRRPAVNPPARAALDKSPLCAI